MLTFSHTTCSEGTADALTEEQTKTFVPQLKAKKSDPAKLAGFVAAGNAFQPSRRGEDLQAGWWFA